MGYKELKIYLSVQQLIKCVEQQGRELCLIIAPGTCRPDLDGEKKDRK